MMLPLPLHRHDNRARVVLVVVVVIVTMMITTTIPRLPRCVVGAAAAHSHPSPLVGDDDDIVLLFPSAWLRHNDDDSDDNNYYKTRETSESLSKLCHSCPVADSHQLVWLEEESEQQHQHDDETTTTNQQKKSVISPHVGGSLRWLMHAIMRTQQSSSDRHQRFNLRMCAMPTNQWRAAPFGAYAVDFNPHQGKATAFDELKVNFTKPCKPAKTYILTGRASNEATQLDDATKSLAKIRGKDADANLLNKHDNVKVRCIALLFIGDEHCDFYPSDGGFIDTGGGSSAHLIDAVRGANRILRFYQSKRWQRVANNKTPSKALATHIPLGWGSSFPSSSSFSGEEDRKRTIVFTFLGAPTSDERTTLVNTLREMNNTVTQLFSEWRMAHAGGEYTEGPSYRHLLENTQFCPCPKGKNFETHRLWEAIAARCIPVVTSSQVDSGSSCGSIGGTTMPPPFVVVDDWSKGSLEAVLRWAEEAPEAVIARRTALVEYEAHMMRDTRDKLEAHLLPPASYG